MNRTKVSHKILLMKSSGNHFIFLPVFYLIRWVMKASKFFGKIAILKIWVLISSWDVKTYFGKLGLKWCIFRHEKKIFYLFTCISFAFVSYCGLMFISMAFACKLQPETGEYCLVKSITFVNYTESAHWSENA